MKQQSVRLSGVVYVKDPQDAQVVKQLRAEIAKLRGENTRLKRQARPAEELDRKEQRLKRAEQVLRMRHDSIQKIKKMTLQAFLNGRNGFQYNQRVEI